MTIRAEHYAAAPTVSLEQLQPGDLNFFATNLAGPSTIHHVGVYVGYGQLIDAPHTGAVIRFDAIRQIDYLGARRPNL